MKKEGNAVTKESVISAWEPKYQVFELAENAAKLFGENVRYECVSAALAAKNCKAATVKDAKQMVDNFMKKEVI